MRCEVKCNKCKKICIVMLTHAPEYNEKIKERCECGGELVRVFIPNKINIRGCSTPAAKD